MSFDRWAKLAEIIIAAAVPALLFIFGNSISTKQATLLEEEQQRRNIEARDNQKRDRRIAEQTRRFDEFALILDMMIDEESSLRSFAGRQMMDTFSSRHGKSADPYVIDLFFVAEKVEEERITRERLKLQKNLETGVGNGDDTGRQTLLLAETRPGDVYSTARAKISENDQEILRLSLNPRLYLQFTGDGDRHVSDHIAELARGISVNSKQLSVLGSEYVPDSIGFSGIELRYHKAADESDALVIEKNLSRLLCADSLAIEDCPAENELTSPIKVVYTTVFEDADNIRPRTFELWIADGAARIASDQPRDIEERLQDILAEQRKPEIQQQIQQEQQQQQH
ncbi:MAG: hypothetical protein AAF225_08330 [Pseudomonadota bacterium]